MKEYQEKYMFAVGELKALCKVINPKVVNVYYTKHDNGEEEVTISFANGYKKKANVTADSLKAMAIDVIGNI